MTDTHTLNQESQALWDSKAAFWDNLMGDEGNRFQRILIAPATERLLNLQGGERVLDVACGNGVMSRRLAQLGAEVLGVDFSERLLELARQRDTRNITYKRIDATDEAALLSLGENGFDAAVCNMAVMDIPTIEPMMRAVKRLVKTGGRFVLSTMHPCFNSNHPIMEMQLTDKDGELVETHSMKFSRYLDIPPVKGMGAPNEPNPHYYFHRPLHEILNAAFAAGWVMNGIEEPAFDANADDPRPLSWYRFHQFPPILTLRLQSS